MFPSGAESTSNRRSPGRWAAVGPIVLAVVFLVALVMAANNNTVLGWFIVVVALAWLVLATLVYVGVHRAARFGADQIRRAQSTLQKNQQGSTADDGGTTLVDSAPSDGVRDMKLDHSFKIVQVQARVIAEQLAASEAGGAASAAAKESIERALETIQITAHNGRDMIGVDKKEGPGEEPVTGVVIDG
ncbi:hypothetical protein FHU41_002716 [Psychromicrobium silvestre]|uniref:Uncharacterized protein n=1 Tax=Psychromicrobium silvestre TaxID=1645614 RepID=A0A7Y9LVR3_9MICC|nr:hypothetical protein [Psychromicrobium silvestre]NYE96466.1 hypothetical protein [Psychromicrobium silvestre]